MLNDADAATAPLPNDLYHSWGNDAPKGGRAVLQRILKEGTKVPLFLGQTLVNSLRDVGYNNTTSAVCEHVDNSLQWGATEVRVGTAIFGGTIILGPILGPLVGDLLLKFDLNDYRIADFGVGPAIT